MELTVNQVREELQQIIWAYPTRDGSYGPTDESFMDEKNCVYFLDQNDQVFSGMNVDPTREFKTPVCIIGQWIHDFHPELKEVEDMKVVLSTNAIIGNSDLAKGVLGDDVVAQLASAQYQQDSANTTWGDIDLDLERRY